MRLTCMRRIIMFDHFTLHSNMCDINVDNESHVVFIEDNVMYSCFQLYRTHNKYNEEYNGKHEGCYHS